MYIVEGRSKTSTDSEAAWLVRLTVITLDFYEIRMYVKNYMKLFVPTSQPVKALAGYIHIDHFA